MSSYYPQRLPLEQSNVFPVSSFGALGDGVTDDTAAITNACYTAAVSGAGAAVTFDAKVYGVSKLNLTDIQNLALVGAGWNASPYDASAATSGTVFKCLSGSGPVLDWSALNAANSLLGCSLENVAFDGANLANVAVQLRSIYGGYFNRVMIKRARTVGLLLSTVNLAGLEDLQGCVFDQVFVNCSQTAATKGITLGSWQAGGGNTSANDFRRLMVYTKDGTGVEVGDADANYFGSLLCNRAGTAIGLDLLGTNAGGGSGYARHNKFEFFQGPGGCTARGTASYTTASGPNYLFNDTGNSTPAPTIEAGASLTVVSL